MSISPAGWQLDETALTTGSAWQMGGALARVDDAATAFHGQNIRPD